jgi:hypothetical protein
LGKLKVGSSWAEAVAKISKERTEAMITFMVLVDSLISVVDCGWVNDPTKEGCTVFGQARTALPGIVSEKTGIQDYQYAPGQE